MPTISIQKPLLPAVQNVVVSGLANSSVVKWDVLEGAVSYEVWRSSTYNSLPTAVLIGETISNFFNESELRGDEIYFYWVRGVDQFGKPGNFSGTDGTLGYTINQLYLAIFSPGKPFASSSVAVDVVQARIIHSEGDTGWMNFSSDPFQVNGFDQWADVDNALVEDGSVATLNMFDAGRAYSMLFKLEDLGVPDTAIVSSMQFRAKASIADNATDTTLMFNITNIDETVSFQDYVSFPAFTAADILQTLTGSSGLFGIGLLGTQRPKGGITVYDLNVTGNNTSSSSISTAPWFALQQPISLYNTWYPVCTTEFRAMASQVYNMTHFFSGKVENIVVGSEEELKVIVRVRVLDVLSNAYISGTTRAELFAHARGTGFDVLFPDSSYTANRGPGPITFNTRLSAGFQGELTPGKEYKLIMELAKVNEYGGTATCDITVHAAELLVSDVDGSFFESSLRE